MEEELTSSTLLELAVICSISCSFGIMYAMPFPKPGSESQEEANMFFSLKFPSTASQNRLRYLCKLILSSSEILAALTAFQPVSSPSRCVEYAYADMSGTGVRDPLVRWSPHRFEYDRVPRVLKASNVDIGVACESIVYSKTIIRMSVDNQ